MLKKISGDITSNDFFRKKPIRRLIFVFIYILCAIWFLNRNFLGVNIVVSLIMLLGGYISLVKSNIIRDKNADKINNFKFDTFNILLTIVLLIDIFITI